MSISHVQLREFVIYLLFIGVLVVMFGNLANAEFQDVKTTDVAASLTTSLISIDGDLNFDKVLPGYQYERNISISFALPPSGISDLSSVSSNVTAFVKISTLLGENSSFVFSDDKSGELTKVVRFSLTCIVVNNSCSLPSIMTKSFVVKFNAPQTGYPYSDKVIVNASLQPIAFDSLEQQFQNVSLTVNALTARIDELKKRIGGSNDEFTKNISYVEQLLKETITQAGLHNFENASQSVDRSTKQLDALELQANGVKPVAPTLVTGRLLGYNFNFSWEHVLLVIFAFAVFSVYMYKKREKIKNIDYGKMIEDHKK